MQHLPPAIVRGNLPAGYAKSNLQRALDDRLTFSEATEIAATILDQFPHVKSSPDGFIGSIAQIATQYPRQVMIECANPVRGVARDCEFLSIANLIAWLEKKTQPLREDADRTMRVEKQLAAREEWKNENPTDRLKAAGHAWLDRTDPVAAKLVGLNDEAEAARKAATLEIIQDANKRLWERERPSAE